MTQVSVIRCHRGEGGGEPKCHVLWTVFGKSKYHVTSGHTGGWRGSKIGKKKCHVLFDWPLRMLKKWSFIWKAKRESKSSKIIWKLLGQNAFAHEKTRRWNFYPRTSRKRTRQERSSRRWKDERWDRITIDFEPTFKQQKLDGWRLGVEGPGVKARPFKVVDVENKVKKKLFFRNYYLRTLTIPGTTQYYRVPTNLWCFSKQQFCCCDFGMSF